MGFLRLEGKVADIGKIEHVRALMLSLIHILYTEALGCALYDGLHLIEVSGSLLDRNHVIQITVSYTHLDVYKRQVEFELDEVDPVLPDEVLELSSPSTFTSGWSFAHEAR